MRAILTEAADGGATQERPIEQQVPAAGARQILVSARSFELDGATPWTLVALEIIHAQETQ